MKKIRKNVGGKPVSADAIARLADEGRDVSGFFTNNGRMMGPTLGQHSPSVSGPSCARYW